MLGSEEGLLSLALTVLRLLKIATSNSISPSDEDTILEEEDILKDDTWSKQAASFVVPPLPKHPYDEVITWFCAIVFVTTVFLLYMFPLPS